MAQFWTLIHFVKGTWRKGYCYLIHFLFPGQNWLIRLILQGFVQTTANGTGLSAAAFEVCNSWKTCQASANWGVRSIFQKSKQEANSNLTYTLSRDTAWVKTVYENNISVWLEYFCLEVWSILNYNRNSMKTPSYFIQSLRCRGRKQLGFGTITIPCVFENKYTAIFDR